LPKKHSIDEVNFIIELYGFKLLSKNYINNKTPLKIQCSQGHIFERTLDSFRINKECPICKKENNIHGLVVPIEDILKEFNYYGFIILKGIENYKNGDSEFLIQCPQGHIYNEKVKYFRQKHKCPYCSKKAKPTIEQINKDFKERNLILLTDFYINKRTKMDFICEKHPNIIQHIDWDHFHNRGQGCKYCGYERVSGENHYEWKGGISSLKNYLVTHILHWKIDSMKNYNYKCVITGERDNWQIHHLYSFSSLIQETLLKTGLRLYSSINQYTLEELELLKNTCLSLHYNYPLGVCLSTVLHKEFHRTYGKSNFIPDDFYVFYKNKTGKEFIPIYKQFEIA